MTSITRPDIGSQESSLPILLSACTAKATAVGAAADKIDSVLKPYLAARSPRNHSWRAHIIPHKAIEISRVRYEVV